MANSSESSEGASVPAPEASANPEPGASDSVEGVLEVGKLREAADFLQARVAAALTAREEDLRAKVSDREGFIREAKRLSGAVDEATQVLGYYEELERIGELDDKGSVELEKIRETMLGLQRNLAEAVQRANALSSHEDVLAVVRDQADAQNAEHVALKRYEAELDSYRREGAEIANELLGLSAELERAQTDVTQLERSYHALLGVEKSERDRILAKVEPDFHNDAADIFFQESNADTILMRLRNLRKQQGVFAMRGKAVIDALCQEEPRFRARIIAYNSFREACDKVEDVKARIQALAKKYLQAYSRASEVDRSPESVRQREKKSAFASPSVFATSALRDGVHEVVFNQAIETAHQEPQRSGHTLVSIMDRQENRALASAYRFFDLGTH